MVSTRARVRAPELTGRGWLNTGGAAYSIADLRGRFVLLDFWTFCCVNCLHVLDELRPLVDDLQVDRLGNLIATKRSADPDGPTILVVAHMDEIGFLVRFVDDRGFVRLQPLGSFDPRVLLAQRVEAAADGHCEVEQDDGRLEPGRLDDRVVPVRRLADHLEGRARADDHAEQHPHRVVVVADQDARCVVV